MSTKIYNGYRLKNLQSFGDVHNFCMSLRKIFYNELSEKIMSWYIDSIVSDVDSCRIGNFKKDEKKYSTITLKYLRYDEEFIKKIKRCEYFNISFLYHKDHGTFAMLYTNNNYTEMFEKIEGVEFFGYWNNTDPMDGVSDDEWEERGVMWKEILNPIDDNPSLIPLYSSLTFELLRDYDYIFSPHKYNLSDEIDKISFEMRCEQCKNKIINQYLFKNSKCFVFDSAYAFQYANIHKKWMKIIDEICGKKILNRVKWRLVKNPFLNETYYHYNTINNLYLDCMNIDRYVSEEIKNEFVKKISKLFEKKYATKKKERAKI